MTARYLLCPGRVRSRSDGNLHRVSAVQLMHLYGVPATECETLSPVPAQRREQLARAQRGDLLALHPREDCDYRLSAREPLAGLLRETLEVCRNCLETEDFEDGGAAMRSLITRCELALAGAG